MPELGDVQFEELTPALLRAILKTQMHARVPPWHATRYSAPRRDDTRSDTINEVVDGRADCFGVWRADAPRRQQLPTKHDTPSLFQVIKLNFAHPECAEN